MYLLKECSSSVPEQMILVVSRPRLCYTSYGNNFTIHGNRGSDLLTLMLNAWWEIIVQFQTFSYRSLRCNTSFIYTNLPVSIDLCAATPIATDSNPSSNETAGGCLPCDCTARAKSICSRKLDPWCSPSYLHESKYNDDLKRFHHM